MARRFKVSLTRRGVSAIAQMQETAAPKLADLIWSALPIEGPVFHAKRSNNEVYTLAAPFGPGEPMPENATIFPIPGDIAYFHLPPVKVVNYVTALKQHLPPELYEIAPRTGLADLGIFYGRNNFLFGPLGPGPGSVFATIVEGLQEFAAACNDVWYAGAADEKLRFSHVDE